MSRDSAPSSDGAYACLMIRSAAVRPAAPARLTRGPAGDPAVPAVRVALADPAMTRGPAAPAVPPGQGMTAVPATPAGPAAAGRATAAGPAARATAGTIVPGRAAVRSRR